MPLQVLQRPNWHATPIELGDLFRLQKNRREARAALFTHQLGWEVRLLIGSQLEVRTQGLWGSGGSAGDGGDVEEGDDREGVERGQLAPEATSKEPRPRRTARCRAAPER